MIRRQLLFGGWPKDIQQYESKLAMTNSHWLYLFCASECVELKTLTMQKGVCVCLNVELQEATSLETCEHSDPFYKLVSHLDTSVPVIPNRCTCWSHRCSLVHLAETRTFRTKVTGETAINCTEKAKNRQPWADGDSGERLERNPKWFLQSYFWMNQNLPNISRNANPEVWVKSIKLLFRLLGCSLSNKSKRTAL